MSVSAPGRRTFWSERKVAWYRRANARSAYADLVLSAVEPLLAACRSALDVGAGFGVHDNAGDEDHSLTVRPHRSCCSSEVRIEEKATMLTLTGRAVVVGLLLVAFVPPAAGDEVSLPPTLVTEGVLPATELEAVFQASTSETEKTYELAPSFQWSPIPSFGLKLVVPLDVVDPRGPEPTTGGIGDVGLLVKYAPLILPEQQLAVGGGIRLTLPTGSERRGLGGTFDVGPFVAVGKGFGPLTLQADAGYAWQLNDPATPDEEGGESLPVHREHGATANVAATLSPIERMGLILELNSVTRVGGEDDGLNERVQLYLTPGMAVELGEGWNLRAGIQLPLTGARQFDYNVIVILTKGYDRPGGSVSRPFRAP